MTTVASWFPIWVEGTRGSRNTIILWVACCGRAYEANIGDVVPSVVYAWFFFLFIFYLRCSTCDLPQDTPIYVHVDASRHGLIANHIAFTNPQHTSRTRHFYAIRPLKIST